VESADELDVSMLGGAELIGITAGASTPADHIETARERIESLVS
jgi:4-hydroxy-3-methylbut-2-enyl diphosphate reductase